MKTPFTLFDLGNWYASLPPTIWVVDDDVFLKPVLARILYEIVPDLHLRWLTDAKEAEMTLLSGNVPDLIISDCLLGPGPTGLDLWEFCQKYYRDLPFLMISGLSSKSIKSLSTRPEVDLPAMIQKPFLVRDCQSQVQELLAQSPSLH